MSKWRRARKFNAERKAMIRECREMMAEQAKIMRLGQSLIGEYAAPVVH